MINFEVKEPENTSDFSGLRRASRDVENTTFDLAGQLKPKMISELIGIVVRLDRIADKLENTEGNANKTPLHYN